MVLNGFFMSQFLAYVNYLSLEKKCSPHTVLAYTKDLESFSDFCLKEYDSGVIKGCVYPQIRSWIVSLVDDGVSNITVNRKVASLKSYYKFFPATQSLFEYTDKDKFVLDEFNKENVDSQGEGVNLTLSTLLNDNMDIVWDKIDNYLGKPIDREWCNKVIQTWRERWHKV